MSEIPSPSRKWLSPKTVLPPLVIVALILGQKWWSNHRRDEAVAQAVGRLRMDDALIRSNYDRARDNSQARSELLDPKNLARYKPFHILFYARYCRPDLRTTFAGYARPDGPESPTMTKAAPDLDKAICSYGESNLKEEDFEALTK